MTTSVIILRIEKTPLFKSCKYRVVTEKGEELCTFFDGTIGECAPERCPWVRRNRT
jgi:hypothetical protein